MSFRNEKTPVHVFIIHGEGDADLIEKEQGKDFGMTWIDVEIKRRGAGEEKAP